MRYYASHQLPKSLQAKKKSPLHILKRHKAKVLVKRCCRVIFGINYQASNGQH